MRLTRVTGVNSWWKSTPLGRRYMAGILLIRRKTQKNQSINTLKGSDSKHAIPVQSDGMYNKPLYSEVGEKPFQPVTQTVYSFVENITNKHQINKVITNKHLSETIRKCMNKRPNTSRTHAEANPGRTKKTLP